MNCVSANCRGMGNHPAVRELRSFVKQLDPTLLFVMETKISAKRVEKLKSTFGFSGCLQWIVMALVAVLDCSGHQQ
jgi:hypothetical protein